MPAIVAAYPLMIDNTLQQAVVLTCLKIIQRWNNFLNIVVDAAQAQHYHPIWWNSNFTIISNHVRKYYGQASNQA